MARSRSGQPSLANHGSDLGPALAAVSLVVVVLLRRPHAAQTERQLAPAIRDVVPDLILIVEEGDFGPLAHVEVPTAAPCGLQTLVEVVEVRGRGGVAVADRVTHAEGPAVMLSQGLRDGIASLQRYGLGHATFNNR